MPRGNISRRKALALGGGHDDTGWMHGRFQIIKR